MYRWRNKLRESVGEIILGLILLLATIISGKELLQITWPDRFARQPFDHVAKFVKNLGPNDLILLSAVHMLSIICMVERKQQNVLIKF